MHAYLVQCGTKAANHGAQDEGAEGEGRVLVVSNVDKVLRNVSPAGDDGLPVDVEGFFVLVIVTIGRLVRVKDRLLIYRSSDIGHLLLERGR